MRHVKTRLVLLLALAVAPLLRADPLATYVEKKRILLVATPTLEDARYARQAALLLPALPELQMRDVAIVVARPGDARRARLPLKDDDFMVALIGLDGGIKLARRDLLTGEELMKEIDTKSLRRSEELSAERERAKQKADKAPVSQPAK
jgi:hypothetical protein